MALTYTVHGHIKRRDGRQEAFWTRTGLSKSAADKLAREQRRESGGVARVVVEEGPAYGHATKKTSTRHTVHGHIERRDGRQDAFWTRTGLSKSAADKLAREQRRESGGVARVVVEEGPAYGHATKKTPAQLQREIDSALAGKGTGLTAAQSAYVELFSQDVRNHPDAYKATVRSDPAAHALQVIDGLEDADVRQFMRDLRAEMRQVSRSAHSTKATGAAKAEQLDRDIAPGLGKSRAQIVRAINSIVRAADGRNVYLVRERLGSGEVRRVTRARTKGRGMDVYLLDAGRWLGVLPEMGDRIDVR